MSTVNQNEMSFTQINSWKKKLIDEASEIFERGQQQLMNQSVRFRLDYSLSNCMEGKLDAEDAIARLVT